MVALRQFADTEEMKIDILKRDVNIDPTALPCTLSHSGLSEQRKQYLDDEIRVFCDEKNRDITCPEPSRKRPGPSTKKYRRLYIYMYAYK